MDVKNVLWVLVISAAPIGELRAGIPTGIKEYDLSWAVVLPISLFGNLVIVPFLLLFLEPGLRLLGRIKMFAGILDWVFKRTRRQGSVIQKYQRLGLFFLVAIPLPGTGAWTGSLAASLFGIEFKAALVPIVAGVFVAGAIVSVLTALGWVGAGLAVACLIVVVALRMWKL